MLDDGRGYELGTFHTGTVNLVRTARLDLADDMCRKTLTAMYMTALVKLLASGSRYISWRQISQKNICSANLEADSFLWKSASSRAGMSLNLFSCEAIADW